MGKSKYIGVRKGREPGVYSCWKEACPQVHGYSGAEYKGFKYRSEAEDYVYGGAGGSRKCYGVQRGHETGVFSSWQETAPLMLGYPGATYKAFNRSEAAAFAAPGTQANAEARTRQLQVQRHQHQHHHQHQHQQQQLQWQGAQGSWVGGEPSEPPGQYYQETYYFAGYMQRRWTPY